MEGSKYYAHFSMPFKVKVDESLDRSSRSLIAGSHRLMKDPVRVQYDIT